MQNLSLRPLNIQKHNAAVNAAQLRCCEVKALNLTLLPCRVVVDLKGSSIISTGEACRGKALAWVALVACKVEWVAVEWVAVADSRLAIVPCAMSVVRPAAW